MSYCYDHESTLLPLATFVHVAQCLEDEYGAIRAIFILNKGGDVLGCVTSIETDEDLDTLIERTVQEVKQGRRGTYRGACAVAIAVTGQAVPTGGYHGSADHLFTKLEGRFAKAKLDLTYWVEVFGAEVRLPNTMLERFGQVTTHCSAAS